MPHPRAPLMMLPAPPLSTPPPKVPIMHQSAQVIKVLTIRQLIHEFMDFIIIYGPDQAVLNELASV